MQKRTKAAPGKRKLLNPTARAQVIIAALGAIIAIAGCVEHLAR